MPVKHSFPAGTKLLPTVNGVLVLIEERKEKSLGGIIIPDAAKQLTAFGTIVAIGPSKKEAEEGTKAQYPFKAGDRVLITAGRMTFGVGDEVYGLINTEDVLLVIKEPK